MAFFMQSELMTTLCSFLFAQYFPDVYAHMKADNFRGDFQSLIYRKDSDDDELADAFRQAWGTLGQPKYELESFPIPVPHKNISDMWTHRLLGNFLRSDHTRFWMQDFPGLFLCDTGEISPTFALWGHL